MKHPRSLSLAPALARGSSPLGSPPTVGERAVVCHPSIQINRVPWGNSTSSPCPCLHEEGVGGIASILVPASVCSDMTNNTPTTSSAGSKQHAPWLPIPSRAISVIEHPCIVKNVDKGIASLGGPVKLSKVTMSTHRLLPHLRLTLMSRA